MTHVTNHQDSIALGPPGIVSSVGHLPSVGVIFLHLLQGTAWPQALKGVGRTTPTCSNGGQDGAGLKGSGESATPPHQHQDPRFCRVRLGRGRTAARAVLQNLILSVFLESEFRDLALSVLGCRNLNPRLASRGL